VTTDLSLSLMGVLLTPFVVAVAVFLGALGWKLFKDGSRS